MRTPADFVVITHLGLPAIALPDGRILAIPGGGEGEDPGADGDGAAGTGGGVEPGTAAVPPTDGDGDAAARASATPAPDPAAVAATARLKTYEGFGEPDKLAERLKRADEFDRREAAENERRLRQQERDDGLTAEERQAVGVLDRLFEKLPASVASKLLDRVAPGTAARLTRLPDTENLQLQEYNAAGFRDMREALATYDGLKVDDELAAHFEPLVEAAVVGNKQWKQDYWNPAMRKRVMDDAVDHIIKTRFNPILQAQGARAIARAQERRRGTLPRPAQSGTPQAKPAEFQSKHAPDTREYDRDRRAHRARTVASILDQPFEEAS